jgi:hypothetical protein
MIVILGLGIVKQIFAARRTAYTFDT